MPAVVGRIWAWISPGNLYHPWASKSKCEKSLNVEGQEKSRWSLGGITSWVWGGGGNQSDQKTPTEEYWEAQEEILKPLTVEDLTAQRLEMVAPQSPPRWWNRIIDTAFHLWPISSKVIGLHKGSRDSDAKDGDFSDYETPPPSPVPFSQRALTFRFFAQSWSGEILPEHYEICFNFLRHLFDLFVIGFLWTVSPPAKFILDVLGVQGALKLWLHGMAMFLVSSVGMAGLLWLVQEYLPQFALIYGIIQTLVISVSVRQSVILGTEDDEKEVEQKEEESEEKTEHDCCDTSKSGNVS